MCADTGVAFAHIMPSRRDPVRQRKAATRVDGRFFHFNPSFALGGTLSGNSDNQVGDAAHPDAVVFRDLLVDLGS